MLSEVRNRAVAAIAYIDKYDNLMSLGFGVISFIFFLLVAVPSGIVFLHCLRRDAYRRLLSLLAALLLCCLGLAFFLVADEDDIENSTFIFYLAWGFLFYGGVACFFFYRLSMKWTKARRQPTSLL
jgi:hypothetical protein